MISPVSAGVFIFIAFLSLTAQPECSAANVNYGQSGQGILKGNDQLLRGQSVLSSSGKFALDMQNDGNLVLYRTKDRKVLWATNTAGSDGQYAVMQADGNFVLYASNVKPLWHTGTFGHPGSWFVIQDDGNLVVYVPGDQALWSTGTQQTYQKSAHIAGPGNYGQSIQGTVYGDELLSRGESVLSPSGNFALDMQNDGNLVLYRTSDRKVQWASNTIGSDGQYAVMQTDGNFVMYDSNGHPIWSTGTHRHPGSWLAMQDDGNLVIYVLGNQVLWSSGTMQTV